MSWTKKRRLRMPMVHNRRATAMKAKNSNMAAMPMRTGPLSVLATIAVELSAVMGTWVWGN